MFLTFKKIFFIFNLRIQLKFLCEYQERNSEISIKFNLYENLIKKINYPRKR